jgi:hypothetical protein
MFIIMGMMEARMRSAIRTFAWMKHLPWKPAALGDGNGHSSVAGIHDAVLLQEQTASLVRRRRAGFIIDGCRRGNDLHGDHVLRGRICMERDLRGSAMARVGPICSPSRCRLAWPARWRAIGVPRRTADISGGGQGLEALLNVAMGVGVR